LLHFQKLGSCQGNINSAFTHFQKRSLLLNDMITDDKLNDMIGKIPGVIFFENFLLEGDKVIMEHMEGSICSSEMYLFGKKILFEIVFFFLK
jgi:hypothetical protein